MADQLKQTIEYWRYKLTNEGAFMTPILFDLVRLTINYLEELKRLQEKVAEVKLAE